MKKSVLAIILIFALGFYSSCVSSGGKIKNQNDGKVTVQTDEKYKIHTFASTGDLDGIKKELANGVNINLIESKLGFTPLIQAVCSNRVDVADFLIKKGANINIADKGGITPLGWAINQDSIECFRLLIKKKAKTETKDIIFSKTPLLYACSKNNPEYAKTLINSGANVNSESKTGETPLLLALSNENSSFMEIIDLLIKKGANVNKANNKGLTPLMACSQKSNTTFAKKLISKGAKVNATMQDTGITALMFAASGACYDMTVLLIDKKADVNKKDNNGYTAMNYARGAAAEMLRTSLYNGGYVDREKSKRYSQIIDLLSSKSKK